MANPSWATASPKTISLVLLTFQNSALILMMHYSRIMPLVEGQRYLASTAVFLSELFKLAISLIMALYDLTIRYPHRPFLSLFAPLLSDVFSRDSWKMGVPASLYTLQNTLQYMAVSNLDASTFQITYQLKILTTAVCSVFLLGRRLSAKKWLSLLSLTVGVALVQLPGSSKSHEPSSGAEEPQSKGWLPQFFSAPAGKRYEHMEGHLVKRADQIVIQQTPQMNPTLGLFAVLIACFSSGLAGVYFEKVLKEFNSKASSGNKAQISLWTRNVQLSFYSLFPALFIGILYKDGEHVTNHGFFAGYNGVVWTTITLQAVGGVIVAVVINYANNIAKNFATSISIVISFVASIFYFDLAISFHYVLGIFVVLGATWLYNFSDSPRGPPPGIEDYEKQEPQRERRPYDLLSDDTMSSSLQPHATDTHSSSRARTPTPEPYHFQTWLSRQQVDKREA